MLLIFLIHTDRWNHPSLFDARNLYYMLFLYIPGQKNLHKHLLSLLKKSPDLNIDLFRFIYHNKTRVSILYSSTAPIDYHNKVYHNGTKNTVRREEKQNRKCGWGVGGGGWRVEK